MIRVTICEDHKIVREGVVQLLRINPGIDVLDAVESGEQLTKSVRQKLPDVILLDLSLPGRSGLDVMKDLIARYATIRYIILSMYPEDQFALRMYKAGASGYLHKDAEPAEMLKAIEMVARGEQYISSGTSRVLYLEATREDDKLPHELLSDREYEVMILLGQGKSNTEIADILNLSHKTVSTYRTRIFDKMRISNLGQLIHYLLKNNLILY